VSSTQSVGQRLAVARTILERAHSFGIPPEDVIIDCLALTVGADSQACLTTLEAVRQVKEELGVNQTLGASNISFGLPERNLINHSFLTLAISSKTLWLGNWPPSPGFAPCAILICRSSALTR